MSSTRNPNMVDQDIVDNADERELWIVGREFERPPYFHAGKGGDTRLARACACASTNRLRPNSDGTYHGGRLEQPHVPCRLILLLPE